MVIVFDLDDTLYPERQFVLSGFAIVANCMEKTHRIVGLYDVMVELFNSGRRNNIFNIALQSLGVQQEAELIAGMVDAYRSHSPSISLFEDANWALRTLNVSFKLGLITDGYAKTQRNKVRALQIDNYFSAMVFSDDKGRDNWKPSAGPYLEICQTLQANPLQCFYVGDNPVKDFVTAKKLGWRTVRIRRQGCEHYYQNCTPEYEAEFSIESLFELPSILGIDR